jgi:carbamate kinase
MRIVIALGGNAMASAEGSIRPEDQRAAIARAADPIADLVAAGHEVVLTHGNGPQVGNLLLKNELAAPVVPPVPLDWCGAQTQGTIGMMLLNALDTALAERGVDKRAVALVSRTRVEPDDEGFRRPTKPIGRYVEQAEVEQLTKLGQQFIEVDGRGWRRVVPSPEPVECLDAPAADSLLAQGYLVVCSGGGGIPTVRRADGTYEGVEAVIDKDLTAAIIAAHLSADVLLIATDVDHVILDWGTPSARPVGEVDPATMRQIAVDQEFAAGSMGPKVEAVTRFVEAAGGTGIITSLDRLAEAVSGDVGTRIVRSRQPL